MHCWDFIIYLIDKRGGDTMKDKKRYYEARVIADKIYSIDSVDKIKEGNILGRLIRANLEIRGWYGVVIDGKKTLFVLK